MIQFSTFNLIETHQLHIVYFQRCNVSRLYINFQLSIFNFQETRPCTSTSDSSDDKRLRGLL